MTIQHEITYGKCHCSQTIDNNLIKNFIIICFQHFSATGVQQSVELNKNQHIMTQYISRLATDSVFRRYATGIIKLLRISWTDSQERYGWHWTPACISRRHHLRHVCFTRCESKNNEAEHSWATPPTVIPKLVSDRSRSSYRSGLRLPEASTLRSYVRHACPLRIIRHYAR